MPAVSAADRARLASPGHRFRVYLALWDAWRPSQDTPLLDEDAPVETVEPGDWKPVLNIGSDRLAFVGEAIAFDAGRSWVAQGAPGGGSVPNGSWSFTGPGATQNFSGDGPHSVTFGTAGLWTASYTAGGQTATRKVRVLADREARVWDVVGVESVAGGLGGGWTSGVTVAPRLGAGPLALADGQGIGLFVEDEWLQADGSWERSPVGAWPDPRLLVSGYVAEGSIRLDANTETVAFSIESLQAQLERLTIHKTHVVWDDPGVADDAPTAGGGTLITGISKLRTAEIVLWLLQTHTNVLERHDFEAPERDDDQHVRDISAEEGSLWGAISGWSESDFAWLFVDAGGAIQLRPNEHLRPNPSPETRLTLSAELLLAATQPREDLQKNVVFVQLRGVRIPDGAQHLAKHPSSLPSSGPGQWLIKDGVPFSDPAYLDAIAPRLYADANRRWTVGAVCGLNRALAPGDRVGLTLAIPSRNIAWTNKPFILDQVAYQLAPGQGVWTTSLSLAEVV